MARDATTHLPLSIPQNHIASHPSPTQPSLAQPNGVAQEAEDATGRPNVVLVADKYGSVTGLSHPSKRSHQNAAETYFEISLPQCVTRFKQGGIRPPWRRNQHLSGIIADDIIASCTDGTVYAFAIVDDPSRVLLKFLENLIMWEERFRLGRQKGATLNDENDDEEIDDDDMTADRLIIDPEWETTGHPQRKSAYAINADVLERFLENDGVDSLKMMLELDYGEILSDRAGATGRWNGNARLLRVKRFREILANVLGAGEFVEGDLDAYAKCIAWLRGVLVDML
jgi:hypothetical protein